MRVLGFDPGTATTGYGVVDQKGSKLLHVAHAELPETEPPPALSDRDRVPAALRHHERARGRTLSGR